ncbi:MAG: hypothetical protein OEN20_11180, partial [Gammaproteobacteria bacterium]|nr:hypothetical protein [Gammaproteobacteria bacterium]
MLSLDAAGLIRLTAAIATLFVAAVTQVQSATVGSFVDDAIAELGFDPAQKTALEAGTVISVGLADIERQPNELTVGAAMMLVRRPLAVVADAVVDDATFRVNTDILDFRRIGDGSQSREQIDAIFRDVGYTVEENAETTKLLRFKDGDEFNFSDREIANFGALEVVDGSAQAQASAALADVLRQRFFAYLGGGLESVEPYVRGRGKSASAGQELTVALSALELLQRHFPVFYQSLLRYPQQLPADTTNRFYWIKRKSGDRPAFVLAHRMEQRTSDYVVGAELQFYVGHSYNSALTLIACVPVEEGTLVLSILRLFTDQVTGFASGMKRNVGRGQVVEAVTDHLEEMRTALEKVIDGGG